MSPDSRIHSLRAACRDYVVGHRSGRMPSGDAGFLTLARQHQLTPLLWSALGDGLPPDDAFARALRYDAYWSMARQARLAALLRDLLPTLVSRSVPVIVLKGAVLADRYYRRPADRPMRDVDLLVHDSDVPTVFAVAREAGLQRYEDRHSLAFDLRFGSALVLTRHPQDARKPSIDLHWDLFDGWQPSRNAATWLERAWGCAEPARVAGYPVHALGREDMLVHLAAHLANHHAFGGLLWFCDLGLMLARDGDELDWDRVLASARELGLRGALSLVFDTLEVLLDVAPPPEVRRSLRRRAPRLDLAHRLVRVRAPRLEAMNRLEHVMPLLLMDRGRDCARALAGALAPSPRWVELRYAARWPRAYARHCANALGVVARTLAGRRGT